MKGCRRSLNFAISRNSIDVSNDCWAVMTSLSYGELACRSLMDREKHLAVRARTLLGEFHDCAGWVQDAGLIGLIV